MDVQFGKIVERTQLDNEGSYIETESTILNYEPVDEKQRFEVRVKVRSEQDELTEYLRFRDETRHMRNAEFGIEHSGKANTEGAYYIVKKYTIRKKDFS